MLSRWRLPAKVNWTLQIRGRRADGFHDLFSWFVALEWYDYLKMHVSSSVTGPRLQVTGPQTRAAPGDDTNLVLRAEELWRTAGGIAAPCRWELEKHIPSGAGLGGGSSDAAGALKALENAADQPLGKERCLQLALQLGSDVPFFFAGEDAEFRGGRGECRLQRAVTDEHWLLLALPKLRLATPTVFAELRPEEWTGQESSPQTFAWPSVPGPNDLQEAALRVSPALRELAHILQPYGFVMSGSGCVYFRPVPDPEAADRIRQSVARPDLDWHCAKFQKGPVIAPPSLL